MKGSSSLLVQLYESLGSIENMTDDELIDLFVQLNRVDLPAGHLSQDLADLKRVRREMDTRGIEPPE